MTSDDVRPAPRSGLRSARTAREWSQSRAGAELRALASTRGGPDASAASLKTQLSRWENGHALPDPAYRELLTVLYGRTAEELGLVDPPPAAPVGAHRLRSALATAAATGPGVLEQWHVQVRAAARLDDELGAAGAGEVTAALVDQLARTLTHTLGASRRAAVAAPLAAAAALAARHALDGDDPALAWAHYDTSASAAGVAGSAAGTLVAALGRAEVLRSVGDARAADQVLDELASPEDLTTARLAAARGITWAELGRPDAARHAMDAAHSALRAAAGGASAIDRHVPDVAVELSDVLRWHGHALTVLHDAAAVDVLARALDGGPRSARHRAELHADLAVAYRALDRSNPAQHHAREASRLAERIGSAAITSRLRGGPP